MAALVRSKCKWHPVSFESFKIEKSKADMFHLNVIKRFRIWTWVAIMKTSIESSYQTVMNGNRSCRF